MSHGVNTTSVERDNFFEARDVEQDATLGEVVKGAERVAKYCKRALNPARQMLIETIVHDSAGKWERIVQALDQAGLMGAAERAFALAQVSERSTNGFKDGSPEVIIQCDEFLDAIGAS